MSFNAGVMCNVLKSQQQCLWQLMYFGMYRDTKGIKNVIKCGHDVAETWEGIKM